uniref:Galanin peptides n=1 Tax=Myotis lucifugus TaxID=59463 RepID=G1PZ69_MYOLU
AQSGAFLLAALLLTALSATLGPRSQVKEKRGWTLNSAGYLLGPNAVDNHRSFHDKHGLAGKRDLQPEDGARAGDSDGRLPWNDDDVRKIMEFLTFLHLKETGVLLPILPSAASWEDTEQS